MYPSLTGIFLPKILMQHSRNRALFYHSLHRQDIWLKKLFSKSCETMCWKLQARQFDKYGREQTFLCLSLILCLLFIPLNSLFSVTKKGAKMYMWTFRCSAPLILCGSVTDFVKSTPFTGWLFIFILRKIPFLLIHEVLFYGFPTRQHSLRAVWRICFLCSSLCGLLQHQWWSLF